MPGYACPIKERMLYSSSKNPVTDLLENALNLAISKKVKDPSLYITTVLLERGKVLNNMLDNHAIF